MATYNVTEKNPTIEKDACFTLFTSEAIDGAHGTTLTIVLLITTTAIITSNLLMLIGLWKTNKAFTTVHKLLFILSILDLIIGVFVAPLQITMLMLASKAPCSLINLQAFSNVFFPLMDGMVLLTLVFIRYQVTTNSKIYRKYSSFHYVYVMLLTSTIPPVALSTWYVLNRRVVEVWSHAYFFITVASFTVILLFVIMTLNVKILTYVNKSGKRTRAYTTTGAATYHKNVSNTILLISVSITVCYLPLIFIFIISGFFLLTKHKDMSELEIIVPWSQIPILINSCLNSVIYIARTRDIKNYYSALFGKKNRELEATYEERHSTQREQNVIDFQIAC